MLRDQIIGDGESLCVISMLSQSNGLANLAGEGGLRLGGSGCKREHKNRGEGCRLADAGHFSSLLSR
jgi:hypothetical protein